MKMLKWVGVFPDGSHERSGPLSFWFAVAGCSSDDLLYWGSRKVFMKTKLSRFFVLGLWAGCLLSLSSCSSRFLKAAPSDLTGFLAQKPELKSERKKTPFLLSGGAVIAPVKGIYIAPISLKHLADESKTLSKVEGSDDGRVEAATKLAVYGRRKFVEAFEKSRNPRYVLLSEPNDDCVILEMAITDLHRNSISGGLLRLVVHPIVEPVLTKPAPGLKGNVAIEGKLTNAKTGEVLFQFADTEESSSLVVPVKDFIPYGQAREAFRNWSKQFEKLTRIAPGERVRDTRVISLF